MHTKKNTILVIDTDPQTQKMLSLILDTPDFKVVGCETGEPELHNGPLRMDLVRHEVYLHNELLAFTPKEYNLLRYFIIHRGKMLTHRQILHEVWGKAHSDDTQYLRVFIGQIREKIEADPANPKLITTEAGIGYRMDICQAAAV